MTYYVSSGTLNLTKPKPKPKPQPIVQISDTAFSSHPLGA